MACPFARATLRTSCKAPFLPPKSSPVRTVCQALKVNVRRTTKYKGDGSHVRVGPCQHIEVQADASDAWRLDAVVDMIQAGGIGIIPTDSYPALVCDMENAESVQALAAIKDANPKKPMSILVRNFRDVDTYTLGWPVSSAPGIPDSFSIVKTILPGCYTFILPASKAMPKLKLRGSTKLRKKQRQTVGVRMPSDSICQALLSRLDRPLLCTSASVGDESKTLEAATLMDVYPDIDFVVDPGYLGEAEPSTVVDMTGPIPEVLRVGKGNPDPFDPYGILQ